MATRLSLCDLVEGNISALNAHLMCEAVVGWPISGILFPSVLLATALLLRLIPSCFPCNLMFLLLDSDTLFIISHLVFLFLLFSAHALSLSARLGQVRSLSHVIDTAGGGTREWLDTSLQEAKHAYPDWFVYVGLTGILEPPSCIDTSRVSIQCTTSLLRGLDSREEKKKKYMTSSQVC